MKKALVLSKETLRTLDEQDLSLVAGGHGEDHSKHWDRRCHHHHSGDWDHRCHHHSGEWDHRCH
jgi:hypothetical protein